MAESNLADAKVVVFRVGREEYAVSIAAVKDVQPWVTPTPVPESPPVVEGVINLRGDVIPVIDLGKLFRTDRLKENSEARIMVMEVEGQQAGFVVDDVTEVHTVVAGSVAAPSPLLRSGRSQTAASVITGIVKMGEGRLVILVDAGAVLRSLALPVLG